MTMTMGHMNFIQWGQVCFAAPFPVLVTFTRCRANVGNSSPFPACTPSDLGGREGDGCPDLAVRWERGMEETYLWTQEHGKGPWCHTLDIAFVALGTFSRVFSIELGLFENWTILKIGLPDAFVNCSQGEFILKSKSTVNYNEVEIVLKRLGMSFWRRPLNFK